MRRITMILNEGQLSNTNCPLPSHAFTIQNSPLAFEILSSRLYSDPTLAIIRELLTNAYDAQVMAGNGKFPAITPTGRANARDTSREDSIQRRMLSSMSMSFLPRSPRISIWDSIPLLISIWKI